MTTVGELMAELARFNPAARVSDVVEPIGCNPNDVQITLGVER